MLFNVSKIVKEIKNTNQNINIYLLKMNYFLNYKNEKIESYVDLINEKYKNIANII